MTEVVNWREVLSSGVSPELEALKLKDPDHFLVGGLHQNVKAWDNVLEGHPLAERIGRWIQDKNYTSSNLLDHFQAPAN